MKTIMTKIFSRRLAVILLVLIPHLRGVNCIASDTSYEVCFTPVENCRQRIINTIAEAKESIHMQAYYFTDFKIAKALVSAKKRGVQVGVILDKGQISNRNTVVPYLQRNGINLYIDYKPAIAHSKLIIVDKTIVIGGSYNYTYSAAVRNAENVTIIKNKGFAERFVANWQNRKRCSLEYIKNTKRALNQRPKNSKKNMAVITGNIKFN